MKDPFVAPLKVVQAIRPIANYLGLTTLPLHAHEAIISFAVYEILHAVVAPAISRTLVPKQYAAFSKKTKINWDSRITSQIQQVFILTLVVYTMAFDDERTHTTWQSRLWGYDGIIGLIQGSATGYFLWDVHLSLQYIDVMGADSLAHAMGWLIITLVGFKPFANYYGPNFMLYELSTPFLNNHWFFDKLGMTGSKLQLINGIGLLTSFALSRLVWGPYQCALLFKDIFRAWQWSPTSGDKCQMMNVSGVEFPVGCRVLPTWLATAYVGGNLFLTVLNFWWFKKMIAALQKRFTKPKEVSDKQVSETVAEVAKKNT